MSESEFERGWRACARASAWDGAVSEERLAIELAAEFVGPIEDPFGGTGEVLIAVVELTLGPTVPAGGAGWRDMQPNVYEARQRPIRTNYIALVPKEQAPPGCEMRVERCPVCGLLLGGTSSSSCRGREGAP